jgi:hypothetical protein
MDAPGRAGRRGRTVTATSTYQIPASLDLSGILRKDLLNLYHFLVPSSLFTDHFLSLPTPFFYGVMIFYGNILWSLWVRAGILGRRRANP